MRGLIMAAQQQARAEVWLYKGLPFEYEEVTNPATGRIWMDRNLGASQVATAFDDADSYGDLFQWGRLDDLHQNRDSTTTAILSPGDVPGHGDFITTSAAPNDWRSPQNDNLWQDGLNVPAPPGFRIPTIAEWIEEIGTWAVTADRKIDGYNSVLKLPTNGYRGADGFLRLIGTDFLMWSSTVDGTNARRLLGRAIFLSTTNNNRSFGEGIRLIKEL